MTREQYIQGCNTGFTSELLYEFYKENIGNKKLYSFEEFSRAFPFYLNSQGSMARFYYENDLKFTPTKLVLQNGTAIHF